jgi:hypothetical protein
MPLNIIILAASSSSVTWRPDLAGPIRRGDVLPIGSLIFLLRSVWSGFGVLMRLSLIRKDADLVQSHRWFGLFLQSGTHPGLIWRPS